MSDDDNQRTPTPIRFDGLPVVHCELTIGPIDLDSAEVKPAHGGGLLVTAKIDAAPPMSSPMDPERLADAREASGGMYMEEYFFELLLAHDHWQAEAEHWKRNEKGSRELREDMEMRMMLAQSEARRLESLRAKLGELVLAKSEDATYWEEKAHDALRAALKWRARSDVKGEDVEAAGLTWAGVDAWVSAQPDGDGNGEWATDGRTLDSWRVKRVDDDGYRVWQHGVGLLIHRGNTLSGVVHNIATCWRRPSFEVLDELVAAEPT